MSLPSITQITTTCTLYVGLLVVWLYWRNKCRDMWGRFFEPPPHHRKTITFPWHKGRNEKKGGIDCAMCIDSLLCRTLISQPVFIPKDENKYYMTNPANKLESNIFLMSGSLMIFSQRIITLAFSRTWYYLEGYVSTANAATFMYLFHV